jgi:hypothetical protein
MLLFPVPQKFNTFNTFNTFATFAIFATAAIFDPAPDYPPLVQRQTPRVQSISERACSPPHSPSPVSDGPGTWVVG